MKKSVYRVLYFAVAILIALSMSYCASISMPTGGPKDTTPPKVTKSLPEEDNTNFDGKKIEINFDEYVILDNASQNILVSPPVKNKPSVKLVGKTVVIKFKDELEPNTTYNISLGNSIKDLHEGNILEDFSFTVSTGPTVDSLSIAGMLLNASDKKPIENAFVTLYDASLENLDSLPMLQEPSQIVRTDKNGNFRFSNLADKDYLVFALKDMNSNYYYDQPNEDVAFLDTVVHAVYDNNKKSKNNDTKSLGAKGKSTDSTFTANTPVDSTALDSIKPINRKALELTLYMFSKTDTTQMINEKKLVERGLLRFVFRQPDKSMNLSYLAPLPDTLHYIENWSPEGDTLLWYFTPDAADSALFLFSDGRDFADTIKMTLKTKTNKSIKFDVTNNAKGGLLMPEDPFTLSFSEPVVGIVPNDSLLLVLDSTTSIPAVFVPIDSSLMRYTLQYDPVEGDTLKLIIPDSVFVGIRGVHNEKKTFNFHRAKEEEYGSLFITVIPPDGIPQVIVELLDESGKVVDKQTVVEKRELEYWYLAAGKYKLRATIDADGNGRWSSGDYSKRFQPEKVVEYKTSLDVRAGWDIDLDEPWDLRQ